MNILLMGQCTLHWGRMEFGNIGNYYIIEPFIRELNTVFPNARIRTTFQMSQDFCKRENIEILPIDTYYSWEKDNTDIAFKELALAYIYSSTGNLVERTNYIENVLWADLVIDYSGDIWGDNADLLGENRFLVGLCKDRVAQLLGKPTVMLAGSPGPFNNLETKEFAKEVYKNFSRVTNRESISHDILEKEGFDLSKTKDLACPAFLFEGAKDINIKNIFAKNGIDIDKGPIVGFILCGWNFTEGPFDKKDRDDSEYIKFVEAIEYINKELKGKVVLISHSNGFPIPPEKFELLHGRDYKIIKQLQKVIEHRGVADNVYCIDEVYDVWTTKAIIGSFDMLVSGRVHGAVAGLSQNIPTVLIDYGHEPKAHKIKGFAKVANVDEYVADPNGDKDIIQKIVKCWNKRELIKINLNRHIPNVKKMAFENFKILSEIVYEYKSKK